MEKNKKVKGITRSIKGTKIRGRIQKKTPKRNEKFGIKKKEKKEKRLARCMSGSKDEVGKERI